MLSALVILAAQGTAALPGYGHDELMAGRHTAAIEEIMANETLEAEDPARLINLGIAHARDGDTAAARQMFEKVLTDRERVQLETSSGTWVDSRQLAARAIAMLERGEFRTDLRLANR